MNNHSKNTAMKNTTQPEAKKPAMVTCEPPGRPSHSTELGNSLAALASQERLQNELLRAEQERLAAQGRPESFD